MYRVAVDVSGRDLRAVGFYDPADGQLTIVGHHAGPRPLSVTGTTAGVGAIDAFRLYQTTRTTPLARAADVPVVDGKFELRVEGDSFFTLTTRGLAKTPTSSAGT
jgi:hypothetical protein